MSLDLILAFAAASALLSLAPGPDNLFVLTHSALHGRRTGVLITLGLCTGLVVHTSAVALGIAAVFTASAAAFSLLKIIGGAYLAYLAWRAFRASASAINSNGGNPSLSAGALYRRGIIMNISNPKVAVFFLAFLPQFADPRGGSLTLQMFMLGAIFIGIALLIFTGIAFLAGFISQRLRDSPAAQVAMHRMAGLVFLGLALRLAVSSR